MRSSRLLMVGLVTIVGANLAWAAPAGVANARAIAISQEKACRQATNSARFAVPLGATVTHKSCVCDKTDRLDLPWLCVGFVKWEKR